MPTSPTDGFPPQRPLLVLVAAGAQRYREYLFTSMTTRYRIHLVSMSEPTWELRYLSGHTVVTDLDRAGTVAAVHAVAACEPVCGVLSWDESKVLQTAEAARALGLPGGHPDAVLRCRDKFRSREALAAAGLTQPAFELVGDVTGALAAARRIGYPVVLKPRAASASFGVVLAANDADVVARFGYPRDTTVPHMPRYEHEVLVEQYLPDPEVSIDAAVHRGRVMPAFAARKEIGFAPYFEETGHLVSHADPLVADPGVLDYLQAVHEILGFTDGWTHTELKLTAAGPQLIEVNARLGGDLIPYLGMRASGIDPGLAAAAVACGVEPQLRPAQELAAAVRFYYVDDDDVTVESIGFDDAALPAATDLAVVLAAPGDVVSRPPAGIVSGRVAFVTVTGNTQDECRRSLDAAEDAICLRTSAPLPASMAGNPAP